MRYFFVNCQVKAETCSYTFIWWKPMFQFLCIKPGMFGVPPQIPNYPSLQYCLWLPDTFNIKFIIPQLLTNAFISGIWYHYTHIQPLWVLRPCPSWKRSDLLMRGSKVRSNLHLHSSRSRSRTWETNHRSIQEFKPKTYKTGTLKWLVIKLNIHMFTILVFIS